jgi:hypothetical protein
MDSELETPSLESVEPNDPTEKQTVCDVCLQENLTGSIVTRKCSRCDYVYCTHFGSPLDALYCVYCLKDIELTEEILIRRSEHISEDTGQVYHRTQRARHIVLGGLDWLFINKKIETINDVELAMAIEYHQAIFNGLCYEREKRRVDHFHRNAGKQYTVRVSTTDTIDPLTEVTIKKVKKTKIVPKSGDETNLRALIDKMLKAGLKPADILAMSKKP